MWKGRYSFHNFGGFMHGGRADVAKLLVPEMPEVLLGLGLNFGGVGGL